VRPTLYEVLPRNLPDEILIPAWSSTMEPVSAKEVQTFLRRFADLRVGSNTLRSLMEITVDRLFKENKITAQQKESVFT
jgi:hypothetical protein